MSFPFYGKEFTFTQPDGSKLKLKGWGDQHNAVFETLDGYTVVENPITGFYEYAMEVDGELKPTAFAANKHLPADFNLMRNLRNSATVVRSKVFSNEGLPPGKTRWQQRIEEAKSEKLFSLRSPEILAAPPSRHTIGNFIGLCLPIQFSDDFGTISKEEIEAFCNQKGYAGFDNNGSVYDYFLDVSGGKLKYSNLVAPYYTAKHPKSYYTDESVALPIRTLELIEEALDFHLANGFDFSSLTSDNKNYVFALNVFYTGHCVNRWAKGLWPHSHSLNKPKNVATNKYVFDYQITNMGNELSLGVFCHENGHMICDFPDLYDYGPQSRGVGNYCLMCRGANSDEKNPTQVGAYLKYKAGWIKKLSELKPGISGKLLSGANEIYILKRNSTEYFLLENRIKKGRDQSLPDEGLAIWHVDEFGNNSNEQMSQIMHYECSLVQADGQYHLEKGLNDGDDNDLFKAPSFTNFGSSTPPRNSWWDGSPIGIEIGNISNIGNEIGFSVYKSSINLK